MIRCFLKAMAVWVWNGCGVVEYYTYWRRRVICRQCARDWPRCPVCGCWLFAYCRLSTSGCANWVHDPPTTGYEPTAD